MQIYSNNKSGNNKIKRNEKRKEIYFDYHIIRKNSRNMKKKFLTFRKY